MSYEQKPDTGSLFKNDKRESDSHPSYKGSAFVGGEHYWVDLWINEAKDGSKWLNLKFRPKEDRAPVPAKEAPKQADRKSLDLDDEVPF